MLDDWSSITASSNVNSDNLRRADPRHPLDFWRGRDHRGRYLFILEGAMPANGFPRQGPAGIELTTHDLGYGKARLTLTLIDSELVELFRALCIDLLKATESLTEKNLTNGMAIVLERLRRWQDMLSKRRTNILSQQKIIGLVGELLFLRDLLLPKMPLNTAINTWRGPYGDEQDFVINAVIFEIKTQMVTTDRRIQISSEDQLDITSGRIILCQQGLGPSLSAADEARTLNQLVEEIGAILAGNTTSYDLFQLGLIEAGYESRPEYDELLWLLTDRIFYDVRDEFPCIIRSDLPEGVEQVKYCLRVDSCRDFIIDINDTMQEVLNVTG